MLLRADKVVDDHRRRQREPAGQFLGNNNDHVPLDPSGNSPPHQTSGTGKRHDLPDVAESDKAVEMKERC